MSSSSDEESGLTLPSRLGTRISLGKRLTIARRKSTGQQPVQHSNTLAASPTTERKPRDRTRLFRSHSNTSQHDCKAQWASALVAQEPMQKSLTDLRSAVAAYESQASDQKWQELSLAQTNITAELDLANAALEKQQAKKGPLAGLDKFSTIALEYSKLFDVVLNSCPEYVSLAWGITKLLLVANINHAKVKENVETHLVSIGERLGLVNQLIYYAPTDKMVEAVALFYSHLSRFLGKALRCYTKSKLITALEAFTFPWEVKFQKVVDLIDLQFRRIQDLSCASHFGATLQNHELLQSIWKGQQEDRGRFQQDRSAEQLRREVKEELREEMKCEIFGLLQSFDTKWVQRFEEMLFQQTTLIKSRDESCVSDFVDSFAPTTLSIVRPEIFLATFVGEPESLFRFRDLAFPLLQNFDHREKYIRATKRSLTAYDYQHTMKVLRHPAMRTWLSSEESGIVWIDSQQLTKHADWMSVLVTHLIDDVARYKYVTRLRYFCHGHSQGNLVSSAAIFIQSLIFQLLLLNRKNFVMRDSKFTQQRFQDAQHDLEGLWALFLDVLVSAKATCIWIFADHVDVLRKEADSESKQNALKLLRWFNDLVERPNITVKILVTARISGPVPLSKEIADGLVLSPHHPVIHVPKGHHRSEATFVAKYSTKRSRLSEANEPKSLEALSNAVSIDDLLAESTSEEEGPLLGHNAVRESAESDPKQLEKRDESSDSDTPSFLDEDILLSSDGDDLTSPMDFRNENQGVSLHLTEDGSSSPSSDEDEFLMGKSGHLRQDVKWELESSEEDDYREKTEVCESSPLSPKIVVGFFEDPFGSHPGSSTSKADRHFHANDGAVSPRNSAIQITAISQEQPIKDDFLSDSESESGFS